MTRSYPGCELWFHGRVFVRKLSWRMRQFRGNSARAKGKAHTVAPVGLFVCDALSAAQAGRGAWATTAPCPRTSAPTFEPVRIAIRLSPGHEPAAVREQLAAIEGVYVETSVAFPAQLTRT